MLHELPAPDPTELGQILTRIHAGVLRYLKRRQLLEEDGLRPPVGDDEAVAALAGAALQTRSSPGGTRAWVTWLGRDPHAEVPFESGRHRPYIPCADLMRRVFEVDVLLCPHCLGKRRIVAFLDDPMIAHRILRHVGLDPEPRPPPLPGQLEMF